MIFEPSSLPRHLPRQARTPHENNNPSKRPKTSFWDILCLAQKAEQENAPGNHSPKTPIFASSNQNHSPALQPSVVCAVDTAEREATGAANVTASSGPEEENTGFEGHTELPTSSAALQYLYHLREALRLANLPKEADRENASGNHSPNTKPIFASSNQNHSPALQPSVVCAVDTAEGEATGAANVTASSGPEEDTGFEGHTEPPTSSAALQYLCQIQAEAATKPNVQSRASDYKPDHDYKLVVKDSDGKGKGLFAGEEIPDKEVVVKFHRQTMKKTQFERDLKSAGLERFHDSCFHDNNMVHYDPAFGPCRSASDPIPAWYRLNHSPFPNLVVEKARSSINFKAIKMINAGDELTFDYKSPDDWWCKETDDCGCELCQPPAST